jgi:hypothetical protein
VLAPNPKNRFRGAGCRAGGGGAVVGVGGDGGDGAGGAVGDGDLMEVLVVESLDIEGLVELLLEAGRSG